jgi:hypothetical protein
MRGFIIATITTAIALLAACESAPKGQQQAAKLNSAIDTFAKASAAAESNLKMTAEAYKTLLEAKGDFNEPYKAFSAGVKTCLGHLDTMKSSLEEADVSASSYFSTYETKLETIEDEAVRADSKARLETKRAGYTALQGHLNRLVDNYTPILKKLKAHSDALGLELTKARIEGIKSQSADVVKLAEAWYANNEASKTEIEAYLKANSASGGEEAPAK